MPKKKQEPNIPSDIVNELAKYSTDCKTVKNKASWIVNNKTFKKSDLSPLIMEWCDWVTVKPEDSNTDVFSKGSSKGSIACTPTGGHCIPNSTVGDSELWKYAQKIAIKNNVSETINKAIPMNKPLWTAIVWLPRYVASVVISLNQ